MSYLVPCPKCGTSMPVELGMSGERLRCDCGAAVEVPTLRVLRDMPRTDDVDEGPGWTWRHGVMVIGAMILVFGLAMGTYLVRNQSAVNPDRYWEQWYANAKPIDAWRMWTYYQRDGISGGMNPSASPMRMKTQEVYFSQMAANLKLLEQQRQWQFMAWAVAAFGLLVMASAFFFQARTRVAMPRLASVEMSPGKKSSHRS